MQDGQHRLQRPLRLAFFKPHVQVAAETPGLRGSADHRADALRSPHVPVFPLHFVSLPSQTLQILLDEDDGALGPFHVGLSPIGSQPATHPRCRVPHLLMVAPDLLNDRQLPAHYQHALVDALQPLLIAA